MKDLTAIRDIANNRALDDYGFNTDDVVVYIAGAGSGKTYALTEELVSCLYTVRPDEAAFTTFTRKGVATGIERAMSAIPGIDKDDLPYFQTLHKMCFTESGLSHVNVVSKKDIEHFNKILGFNISISDNPFGHQTADDKLLQRYDSIRSGASSSIYVHENYDVERYERFVNAYEKFKTTNGLLDFYDSLILYCKVGNPLPVEVFFLDEAQDITPLQWRVISIASANAKKIRIGGDPAQSIFSYQGASPQMLIHLAEKYTAVHLNKSFRMPVRVCAVADSITDMMHGNLSRKHESASGDEGVVKEIGDKQTMIQLINSDILKHGYGAGRWFLLFRTNAMVIDTAELLDSMSIPYHSTLGFCVPEKYLSRIEKYLKFSLSGFGSVKSRENFMRKYEIEDFSLPFSESNLIPTEKKYLYAEYVDRYGIAKLREMAEGEPYVMLSTTYKVKGGEADNVAVFLDATGSVSKNMMIDLDGELRVFYVACTRARKGLYVVRAETVYNLEDIWDAVKTTLPAGTVS